MNNIDEDIEYLKNYKYDNEVRQAIDNVLSELEPLRELNIPAKTLVAEHIRLENIEDNTAQLKYELETQINNTHILQSQLDIANAEKITYKKIAEKLESMVLDMSHYYDDFKQGTLIDLVRKEIENES